VRTGTFCVFVLSGLHICPVLSEDTAGPTSVTLYNIPGFYGICSPDDGLLCISAPCSG